jgi:hypothetical protein
LTTIERIPIERSQKATKSQGKTLETKFSSISQAPPQPKPTSRQKLGKGAAEEKLQTQMKRRSKTQPEDKTIPKPQWKLKT